MIKNCPICGKAFDVLYPDIWRYKRNNRFICSWKCIRLFDRKEERQVKERVSVKRTRMNRDDMAEAVRMWKANDPGLDQYLTDHGITHIGKWKQNAKIRYREKPADYGQPIPGFGPWDEEPAATLKVDGPLKIETKEPEKVKVERLHELPEVEEKYSPDLFDKYQTVTIRHPNLGVFYYDQKFHCIDWRSEEGDEISLSLQAWSELHKDLPEIFKRLGVEL